MKLRAKINIENKDLQYLSHCFLVVQKWFGWFLRHDFAMQPWLAWFSLCRQHRSQHKASFMPQPPESYVPGWGSVFTTACLTLGYVLFLCSSLEQITTGHEALSKMVKMFYT